MTTHYEQATADNASKAFDTLRAQFALAKHELRCMGGEGAITYEVRRWGHARTFANLSAVEAFLKQIQFGGNA